MSWVANILFVFFLLMKQNIDMIVLPFPNFLVETCGLHVSYSLVSLGIYDEEYGHWYHGRGSQPW